MMGQSVLSPFIGVRHQQESTACFDQVLSRLLADLGTPVPLHCWTMREPVDAPKGQSGLTLFDAIDLGAFANRLSPQRRIMKLDIGDPLLARRLIELAPHSGILVPVSLMLVGESKHRSCTLSYMVPSSLIVLEDNPALIFAVRELDARVGALVRMAAATDGENVL